MGDDVRSALPILLGIDVGTTRVKAVAVGLDGGELALVDRPTPWVKYGTNIEMDPEGLARVIRAVVAGVSDKAAVDRSSGVGVVGIGVTGMGEAGVLVDQQGSPLNRIVGWHDPRGDVETIRREIGVDAFHRAVGMPLNAQPSLAKIIWLQRVNPGLAGSARFLSVPEWAVVCLGGAPVSELSLASRTGLLDVGEVAPFAGAVALLGRNLLSEIVVAGTPAGNGTPRGAAGRRARRRTDGRRPRPPGSRARSRRRATQRAVQLDGLRGVTRPLRRGAARPGGRRASR